MSARDRARAVWIGRAFAAALSTSCNQPGPGQAPNSRTPSADDLRGITLQTLDIPLSGSGASQYGATPNHRLTRIEQAIGERLSAGGLTHRPALSMMTHELVLRTPDEVNVPPSLVDALMAWAGLVDPPPRLVVVELGDSADGCEQRGGPQCEAIIESIASQAAAVVTDDPAVEPSALQYGVGVAAPQGHTRMMVAILAPALVLDPIAVAHRSGAAVPIRGRLLGPRARPVLEVIEAATGSVPTPVALSVDGTFQATMTCGRDGTYQVEVLAEGPYGPEVAANFPIYCGIRPPTRLRVDVEHVAREVDAAQIARANFIYLNAERTRRGLPALSWDPDAAAVARKHSQDMHDDGFVGHRSPSTGEVTQRFAKARLTGTVIRENVARGYGPKGIHDSLMRSPGHRVNLLAADVTHVGVGAVLGEPEANVANAPRPVFATQNFYKKPGAGAPPDHALASTVQRRVDRLRRQASVEAIAWDPALAAVAVKRAAVLSAGRKAPPGMEAEVFALGFAAVQSHRLRSADFDALTTAALWREALPAGARVGLAVVRVAATRTTEEGFLAVVVVGEQP